MVATPVITYQGPRLTAVAVADTHDYSVAFLGTADGHLKKVNETRFLSLIDSQM